MSREQDKIKIDIEDITPTSEIVKQLGLKLHWWRAVVAHIIAIVLIGALVLSILPYVLLLCRHPEQEEVIVSAFEKWYGIIGPFAGLALGAYYGASKFRQ